MTRLPAAPSPLRSTATAIYNVRLLDQYAKRTGRDPSEMSEEEVSQFIVQRKDRKIA